jgi:hypothetical protein
MKKCEIFVNFIPEELDIIKSKFSQEKFVFFTNDLIILKEGTEKGLNIEMLGTHFGFFTPEDDEINENAINHLNLIEKNLENQQLERRSLVRGLRYVNLINFMNIERIKKILETKEKVIFLFSNFAFYYPVILYLLKNSKHENVYKIATVDNLQIKTVDLQKRLSRFRNLEYRLQNRKINELTYDSFAFRASKIKRSLNKVKIGFFLINNQTDFYLKPIYPIINKLIEQNESILTYIFEERTKKQVNAQGISASSINKEFIELILPYSESIKKHFEITIRKNENKLRKKIKENLIRIDYYLLKIFRKNKIQTRESKQTRKIIIKTLEFLVKLLLISYSIFDLVIQLTRKKIFLFQYFVLQSYIKYFEKYQFIKKIVAHQWFKSRIIKDRAGLDDDGSMFSFLDYKSYSIPSIEINKVLKFVGDAKKIESKNKLVDNYLKHYDDNYVVGLTVKLLIVHANINKILKIKKFESIIIGADSPPMNNVVCNIAKHYKISTYSIPQVFLKFPKISTMLPNASKILVSGDRVKKEFVRLGMKENKIIVTGNPRYDYISKKSRNKKQIFNNNILVAMSRWHDKDPEWMSELIKFCNEKKFNVTIKIHPMYKFGTNYDFSEKMINEIKRKCGKMNYLISYKLNLTDTIPKSAILITEYSIVAVEAIFNKVPVITFNFNRDKDNEYSKVYQEEKIAMNAKNIKELFDNITKLIHSKEIQNKFKKQSTKFNLDFNYLNDGKAAERISDILNKTNS